MPLGAGARGTHSMTQLPPEPLVPGNTLITATPEEGRVLATIAPANNDGRK